ncbi:hypothetical protein LguiA_013252 [Lonicera macranthoides]
MDFIVLDMQPVFNPENEIPIILGRPFLATSNAIINWKNRIVKLAFGNMTLELNVFSISNKQDDFDDEIEHVNMIESLVQDHFSFTYESELLEDLLTTSNDPEECVHVFSLDDRNSEELLKQKGDAQVEPPTLEGKMELKSLPSNLKYTFLGVTETYPVVISFELSKEQEVRLVSMLSK